MKNDNKKPNWIVRTIRLMMRSWQQMWYRHEWQGDTLGDESAAWFIQHRPGMWSHLCTKCGKYDIHHPSWGNEDTPDFDVTDDPVSLQQTLINLLDRVKSSQGMDVAANSARDLLLQWAEGGDLLLEETMSAWEMYLDDMEEEGSGTTTERHGSWVPAIPL